MKRTIFICILLLIYAFALIGDFAACSAQQDPWRYRAGLRNSSGSRRLSAPQLQKALDSLRHKTGFLEIRFDEAGFLSLGDRTRFVGGSATARELLIATVDGRVAIELEAHNNSSEIAFADILAGVAYTNFQTKAQIEVRRLRIDFSDFAELRGKREALSAFDLGFVVLHELVHGVAGLRDADGEMTRLGACEERINQMRRELNLPERQAYNTSIQVVISSPIGATMRAELVFARDRRQSGGDGTDWFYLHWDAKRVASATKSKHANS